MGSGYKATPMGIQALVERFRDLERQVASLRRTLTNPLVGNGSLSAPVVPAEAHNSASPGFSLSTSTTERAVITVAVPAGFSRAVVMAGATVHARNTSASLDVLLIGPAVNGSQLASAFGETDVPVGNTGGVAAFGSTVLSSLGASFTVSALVRSGSNTWSGDPINGLDVSAGILFFR